MKLFLYALSLLISCQALAFGREVGNGGYSKTRPYIHCASPSPRLHFFFYPSQANASEILLYDATSITRRTVEWSKTEESCCPPHSTGCGGCDPFIILTTYSGGDEKGLFEIKINHARKSIQGWVDWKSEKAIPVTCTEGPSHEVGN